MIEGLMLFGSAARGDNDINSDVDILGIKDIERPMLRGHLGVDIQFFSPEKLLDLSREGNLFAIHLAYEGKVIFDSTGIFNTFKESLVVRKEYLNEKKWANDLAWYLYYEREASNFLLINKRIAWCVRTYLISVLVERGKVVFSPKNLKREFSDQFVSDLIDLRRSASNDEYRFFRLKEFVDRLNIGCPSVNNKNEFRAYFIETKNNVGLSTFDQLNYDKGDEFSADY